MDYIIEGGHPLHGRIAVPGAKNAALHILVATLLTDAPIEIDRVPSVRDVDTLSSLLRSLGKRIEPDGAERRRVTPSGPLRAEAPVDEVRNTRASFHVLGPLLARCGQATVPTPGGDRIGERPVDLHLDGLRAMGAAIDEYDGFVRARAQTLAPADIRLRFPSVGATEHLMMTAAHVPGRTVIRNPAPEPEVQDLSRFLTTLGAAVECHPTYVAVEGRRHLHGGEHAIMPDRLQAGTLAIGAALAGGELDIRCDPWHVRPLTATLQAMTIDIAERADGLVVRGTAPREYRPTAIETRPYPGFPTDMHPPIMPLLALTPGESRLTETIFGDRFSYADGLRRLGADVSVEGRTARVKGVAQLSGGDVEERRDNRAAAALVLAGLAAEGTTVVRDEYHHVSRGYGDFAATLSELGAMIWTDEQPSH
ncbi:MAG: UDP-N-acetylglucosamine 1-carboxyvinyltransferase [Candidatus Bipolaricaulia bacterium]